VAGSCRLVLGRPPRASSLLSGRRPRPPARRRKGRRQGCAARQGTPAASGGEPHLARRLPLRGVPFPGVFPQVRPQDAEQLGLPVGQPLQKSLGAYTRGRLPAQHFPADLAGRHEALVPRARLRRRPPYRGSRHQPRLPRRHLSPRQARTHRRREQPIAHWLNGLMMDNHRAWSVLVRPPALQGRLPKLSRVPSTCSRLACVLHWKTRVASRLSPSSLEKRVSGVAWHR
jgi:hypothetical protein